MFVIRSKSAAVLALWAAVLGIALARPALGQQPSERLKTPKLTKAASEGWFRASIVQGRIEVQGRRFGSPALKTPNEQFIIRAVGGRASISYQLTGSEGKFSLQLSDGNRLHIVHEPAADSSRPRLEYEQAPAEPIRLTVGAGEDQTVYVAKDLWYLLLAEPEVCREHLAPLVEVLIRDQNLAKLARQLETALVKAGSAGTGAERERWAKLVDALGDDRFSRREAADRQLRQVGPAVVTFLTRLDPLHLDAEQQYRIRRIVRALSDRSSEDTPELAASWLAGDPTVWLDLMEREEESTRKVATRQLETILGKPVPFDPTADAATRQAQIDKLRAAIPE